MILILARITVDTWTDAQPPLRLTPDAIADSVVSAMADEKDAEDDEEYQKRLH